MLPISMLLNFILAPIFLVHLVVGFLIGFFEKGNILFYFV